MQFAYQIPNLSLTLLFITITYEKVDNDIFGMCNYSVVYCWHKRW